MDRFLGLFGSREKDLFPKLLWGFTHGEKYKIMLRKTRCPAVEVDLITRITWSSGVTERCLAQGHRAQSSGCMGARLRP